MTEVHLQINGRAISADVEPRQHLADFVREEMLLTGTHLGCEHGVCGACTVLIDGAPARACIAFTVGLEGCAITTIEGLADDPVMARLREAFSIEHGLQCGFCTPGMLIMARDIVLRRPSADTKTIRHELAGNLCRCTGYVGIVRAVKRVADEVPGELPRITRGSAVAVPGGHASPLSLPVSPRRRAAHSVAQGEAAPVIAPSSIAPTSIGRTDDASEPLRNPVEIQQEFSVPAGRADVWDFFQDPARVVACLPGARLTAPSDGRTIQAEMVVKLGPIQAAFGGSGVMSTDAAAWSGTIEGSGVDARSATRVRAQLVYWLDEHGGEHATKVSVGISYVLQGPLAQMSRGALARDLAARLTQTFAANLSAALAGDAMPAARAPLDAGSLVLSVLPDWLRRLFRRG